MTDNINGIPVRWNAQADGEMLMGLQPATAAGMQQTLANTAGGYRSPFDDSPFTSQTASDVDEKKEIRILEETKSYLNNIVLCASGTEVFKKYEEAQKMQDKDAPLRLNLLCENEDGSNLFDTTYLIQLGSEHKAYIQKLKNGAYSDEGIDGISGGVVKKKIYGINSKFDYLILLAEEEMAKNAQHAKALKYRKPTRKELEKALELEMSFDNDAWGWLSWYYGIDEWLAGKINDLGDWIKGLQFREDQYNYVEGKEYNPVLPIHFVQELLEEITERLRANKQDIIASVDTFSEDVRSVLKRIDDSFFIRKVPGCVQRFFEKVKSFINSVLDFVAGIAAKIDTMFEEFAAELVEGLRIINAVLCGIVDGFLSLLEGLVKLIGFLVDNVVAWALGMDADESVTSEGRMKSMNRLEAFEELYDVITQNWSSAVEAIKMFFAEMSWEKLRQLFSDVLEKVTRYEIAHFAGSCIFDIIAGVILALVTGGASAIAQAATKTQKLLKVLQLIARETLSSVTMGIYDVALLLKTFFTRLAQAAANGFESVFQFFKKLINGFFGLLDEPQVIALEEVVVKAVRSKNPKLLTLIPLPGFALASIQYLTLLGIRVYEYASQTYKVYHRGVEVFSGSRYAVKKILAEAESTGKRGGKEAAALYFSRLGTKLTEKTLVAADGTVIGKLIRKESLNRVPPEIEFELADFLLGDKRKTNLNCFVTLATESKSPAVAGKNIFYADFNIPPVINDALQNNKNFTGDFSLGKAVFDDGFAALEKHVGNQLDGIYGEWIKSDAYKQYGGESVNLKKFKEALSKGMSMEKAAFETVTGQWAKEKGFTTVEFIVKPPDIKNIKRVEVIFKR
jgi:hypothetical protein